MFRLKDYRDRLGSKKANIVFMLILKIVYEVIFALVTSKLYAYIGLWYDSFLLDILYYSAHELKIFFLLQDHFVKH